MAIFVPHVNVQVCRSIVICTQCQTRSIKHLLYALYNPKWKLFSGFQNDTPYGRMKVQTRRVQAPTDLCAV